LVEKGLTEKQAVRLLAEQIPEVITTQLEYLPFRLEDYRAQGRDVNVAAVLYDSIKENWKPPDGYLNAEKEKEREARRREEEKQAQLQREKEERKEQEHAILEAYKEKMDSEERQNLRERALREIRNTEGIREDFISDILIDAWENQILKSEI